MASASPHYGTGLKSPIPGCFGTDGFSLVLRGTKVADSRLFGTDGFSLAFYGTKVADSRLFGTDGFSLATYGTGLKSPTPEYFARTFIKKEVYI
jgi:hypothetical protein